MTTIRRTSQRRGVADLVFVPVATLFVGTLFGLVLAVFVSLDGRPLVENPPKQREGAEFDSGVASHSTQALARAIREP